jgi:hypothetical protein
VRALELGLEWEGTPSLNFDLILQDLPERRQHVVRDFELSEGDRVRLRGEWRLPEEGQSVFPSAYQLSEPGGWKGEARVDWHGLVPHITQAGFGSEQVQVLEALHERFEELLSTEWIGAIRRTPERIRLIPDAPPVTLGPDGEGAADLLAWDVVTGGVLLDRVGPWYQTHTGSPLGVKQEGRTYSLVVGRAEVNILDTGEGLAQVLPVLVAAAVAERRAQEEKGTFHLVLEQPELHLHPAAHAPLATWLCDIARKESAPRMVVETHSENFLFGVQLAVAKRELNPEHVRIYWVRQEQGRSMVSHIAMDEWGRLHGWPREVFTEETELARQLLEERRKRGYR